MKEEPSGALPDGSGPQPGQPRITVRCRASVMLPRAPRSSFSSGGTRESRHRRVSARLRASLIQGLVPTVYIVILDGTAAATALQLTCNAGTLRMEICRATRLFLPAHHAGR